MTNTALPLISVLIPTYNVEKYIEEAIRSILNQTYRNIELIVVDDSSEDSTFAILTSLSKIDDRIRLYRNEVNSKIVKTLNFAISVAKGTFYARMDGDDISAPNRLMDQYKFLIENPDIDLVGTNVTMIDEDSRHIHQQYYPTSPVQVTQASKYISPIPHFWLARKNLYDTIGSYRIPSAEDLDFILRCLDAGHLLSNHPEFLYCQRMRAGNTATALGLIQRKSISYVRQLQKQRIARNRDSYSEENLALALSSSDLEKFLFKQSAQFHFNYVKYKSKKPIIAFTNMAISILLSPIHQLSQIYERSRYKLLMAGRIRNKQ